MLALSHVHQLFSVETCQTYIHALRWKDRPLQCLRCQSHDVGKYIQTEKNLCYTTSIWMNASARYRQENAMSTLGERLSAVREHKGWTQSEVAQRAHLPQQALSRLERGDRAHVRSDVLARLAIALDVSADVLLGLRDMVEAADPTPPAPQPPAKRPRTRKAAAGR